MEQTKPGTKAATNGRKDGGNFVMEDDDNGDMTASSTSDSEVVVVVSDVRRSNVDKKRVDKKKVEKGRLKVRNEEERVRTLVSVFLAVGLYSEVKKTRTITIITIIMLICHKRND